jgi:hypothetical protein
VNNLRAVEQRAPPGVDFPTRASEGLPRAAFVFAHFNTLRKVGGEKGLFEGREGVVQR